MTPPNFPNSDNPDITARIVGLRLETAVPLLEMRTFYHELLGLVIVEESAHEFTLAAGDTDVTFAQAGPAFGEPFYHVAFTIPENQILAAHKWLGSRTSLLRPRAEVFAKRRDSTFPDEIVHFSSWQTHSVFFWDPAGNLIEFAARHNLRNAAGGPFTSTDILCASEIMLVVDDVPAMAARLRAGLALQQYREPWTLGDERGLILLMQEGKNWGSMPSYQDRPTAVYPTEVTIRGERQGIFSFPDYPYKIFVV